MEYITFFLVLIFVLWLIGCIFVADFRIWNESQDAEPNVENWNEDSTEELTSESIVKSTVDYPEVFVSQNMNVAIIYRDNGGMFRTMAVIDSKAIEFLVDTGASEVALSLGDAERIGFDINELDFSVRVSMAVGVVDVAEIVINSIRIGQIEVCNIPATVLPSNDKSLLGLSFLSELYSYEFRNHSLIMKQQIRSSSKTVIIKRDSEGLFRTLADVDSKEIEFLVDTGASYVTLSFYDAERLGFDPKELIFSRSLKTSIGLFKGAEVLINSIRIGQIEVFNVEAFVINGLDDSVLGLSFLSKLQSWEFRDLGLVIRQ